MRLRRTECFTTEDTAVFCTEGTEAFASFFLLRDTEEVNLRLTGIAGGYQIVLTRQRRASAGCGGAGRGKGPLCSLKGRFRKSIFQAKALCPL